MCGAALWKLLKAALVMMDAVFVNSKREEEKWHKSENQLDRQEGD